MNELKNFSNNNNKTVAIQGLGFVGSVMSLVCANAINEEYNVIGVETPTDHGKKLVENLNNGNFPLYCEDPKIEIFYKKTISKGNFIATTSTDAYLYADVIIVDINLDVEKENSNLGSLKSFNVDLTSFKNAIKSIGNKCKPDALILIETTVPPGTCAKIVRPIIYDLLKERNLPTGKIKIGHSYERVMPGPDYIDSIQNFYRVYSGVDEQSANAVESFLHTIITTDEYPLTRLENTNSTEIAKVLENSYRAMNIAFMVEWSRFSEEAGVNIYDIVNAIRLRPTHANLMYPGIGVGGYCLTKDALLASWARQNLFNSDESLGQSEMAININDQMPRFAFEFLKKHFSNLSKSKILFLGISYRGDIGDTRSTPVEKLYNYIKNECRKILCHDPYIKYWDEKSLRIEQELEKQLNSSPDLILITTGHSIYKEDKTIEAILKLKPLFIYDIVGLLSTENIKILMTKHKVKVLGRGDI